MNIVHFNDKSYVIEQPSYEDTLLEIVKPECKTPEIHPNGLTVENYAAEVLEFVINNFDGGDHPLHVISRAIASTVCRGEGAD